MASILTTANSHWPWQSNRFVSLLYSASYRVGALSPSLSSSRTNLKVCRALPRSTAPPGMSISDGSMLTPRFSPIVPR